MPGSVRARDEANPVYHRRNTVLCNICTLLPKLIYFLFLQLAAARLKFLKENNYPRRYRELIDPKATSDDEADPSGRTIRGQKVYLINQRRERSSDFEAFIRLLDKKRYETAQVDPSKRWRERLRELPSQPKQTTYPALPCNMPIDYFDHQYYNSLQPHLRHHITNAKIALLPDVSLSFSGTADEKLTDDAFNGKYGAQVLAKYNLVNETEIDEEDEWLVLDDDVDTDMLEDDEYVDNGIAAEDDMMSARQNTLAAQLV